MDAVPNGQIAEFVEAARRVGAYGLVRCSSGNLSWRIDGERMLVTASKAWMAELTPEQVVVCRLADCEPLNDRRPSIETRFHAAILRERRRCGSSSTSSRPAPRGVCMRPRLRPAAAP